MPEKTSLEAISTTCSLATITVSANTILIIIIITGGF